MHHADGRVVSNFIVQALRNEDITIYGNGQQTRSFGNVDDLISGFTALMNTTTPLSTPINLGNPVEFTVRELAEEVISITGSKSTLKMCPIPQDDPQQRRPDISQATEHLNWKPTVQLREGLQRTILYFEDRLTKVA